MADLKDPAQVMKKAVEAFQAQAGTSEGVEGYHPRHQWCVKTPDSHGIDFVIVEHQGTEHRIPVVKEAKRGARARNGSTSQSPGRGKGSGPLPDPL